MKSTKMLIVLMVINIIGISCFASAQNSEGDANVEIDVMLLYKTVDQQIARFTFFADSILDIYVYYQTEEEHDKNIDFKNMEWTHLTHVNSMPMGDFYDQLKVKNINQKNYYGVGYGIDIEPSSKYYYKVVIKNGPVLKEGSFTALAPLDTDSYPDFSILDGYLEIDYLQGSEYEASRKKGFYAVLKAKYQDKIIYDGNKKIINVLFHNSATNISLISKHGLLGYWPESYVPTGPYLTKDEFNCFFVNGENQISVTIEAEDAIEDVNKNNNQFTKVLSLDGIEEISDEFCSIDGKIFSAKMRVEWNDINFNKSPTLKSKDDSLSNLEKEDNESVIQSGKSLIETKIENIIIMPETVSQKAIETLKLKKDMVIELKETGKPTYEVTGMKNVKIFGLFTKEMKIVVEINAESGEIEKIRKPWWSFLAKE